MTTIFRAEQLKVVLVSTGLILTLAMGVRHGFGLWLAPIIKAHGWKRETYSLAIALQNLMWGILGPIAGMMADRFSTKRVVIVGAVLYALGLFVMGFVNHTFLFIVGVGVFIGGGLACTGFGALSGIIARVAPEEKRSWAFGVAGAASSFGQFAMMPMERDMIVYFGWQNALVWLGVLVMLIMVPMAFRLSEPASHSVSGQKQSVLEVTKEAFSCPSFLFLLAGYFVCGFQLIFINIHLPAYLIDKGVTDPTVGVFSLALIGLFNIFGSFMAGVWGGRFSKKYLLSLTYALRAVIIGLFVFLPLSNLSIYLFACGMGFLWLSTIPLTNGVIAGIFGVRYLSMLSGFVFLFHQIGAFLGVWIGGYLFDRQNSYHTVWMITIVLGVFAALINLPINEKPIKRVVPHVGTA
jgi:MFS family permease